MGATPVVVLAVLLGGAPGRVSSAALGATELHPSIREDIALEPKVFLPWQSRPKFTVTTFASTTVPFTCDDTYSRCLTGGLSLTNTNVNNILAVPRLLPKAAHGNKSPRLEETPFPVGEDATPALQSKLPPVKTSESPAGGHDDNHADVDESVELWTVLEHPEFVEASDTEQNSGSVAAVAAAASEPQRRRRRANDRQKTRTDADRFTPDQTEDFEQARFLLPGISNLYRKTVTVTSTLTYTDLSLTVASYRTDCRTLGTLPRCPAGTTTSGLVDTVNSAVSGVGSAVSGVVGGVGSAVGGAVDAVGGAVGGVVDAVGGAATGVVDAATGTVAAATGAGTGGTGTPGDVVDSVVAATPGVGK